MSRGYLPNFWKRQIHWFLLWRFGFSELGPSHYSRSSRPSGFQMSAEDIFDSVQAPSWAESLQDKNADWEEADDSFFRRFYPRN